MARIPALVVTHADLGAALLRAAQQVYGPIEGVQVLSNTQSLPESIAGLRTSNACVKVGPPLFCNGPSSGLTPSQLPEPLTMVQPERFWIRL